MRQVIQNRIDWMDWAKTLAIFVVVMGHILGPLMPLMYYFHMPYFMMLSGYLQKDRPVSVELRKSARSLLVPYVIYNLYLLVYSFLTGEYTSDYPWSMLCGMQWNLSMACRPLWFLLALFWIRMLHATLPKWGRLCMALVCVILMFALNGSSIMAPENDWFQIFPTLICLPFFELGSLLHHTDFVTHVRGFRPFATLPVLLITMGIGFYLSSMNGKVNIFRCHPADNALLFYLAAGLISVSLVCLAAILLNRSNSYIQLVSEGTLIIFAVHQSILWPLHEIIPQNALIDIAIALLTIFVLSGAAWLARRYCPILIGK